jgi:SAM-dependent methyltransferase
MSGFSPEWLSLRESADHRSRNADLAQSVAARFAEREQVSIVDLGCGTGSNLRCTSNLFHANQQAWTLVDYDPKLLAAASDKLAAWADRAIKDEAGLVLTKGRRTITVAFRQADLTKELDRALGETSGETADLITASAFFDLCSVSFIETFAAAVAARKASFYTVLTYNGQQTWTPPHSADATFAAAFHAHQVTDKGFGGAAGPTAADALATAFKSVGYRVSEGDSPWRLANPGDQTLVGELVPGFAGAVRETGAVNDATIDGWLKVLRTGAHVGHTDTFAVPR